MTIRKKYNLVLTINLILILFILVLFVFISRIYFYNSELQEVERVEEEKIKVKTDTNIDYIGIYENVEESDCTKRTTLVLSENYSFIFYIGDCNLDSFYHGKYKIENKEIILYDIKVQDTSILEELKVNEDISFHILDVDTINSVFGRSEGIILKRKINVV